MVCVEIRIWNCELTGAKPADRSRPVESPGFNKRTRTLIYEPSLDVIWTVGLEIRAFALVAFGSSEFDIRTSGGGEYCQDFDYEKFATIALGRVGGSANRTSRLSILVRPLCSLDNHLAFTCALSSFLCWRRFP